MPESVIDSVTYGQLQATAGADFVAELVDAFLEEAPGMLAELRSARADADPDRFRRAAHSLKSNCHTFGAMALGALARELELNGMTANDDACIAALEAEYSRAAAALKQLRHG